MIITVIALEWTATGEPLRQRSTQIAAARLPVLPAQFQEVAPSIWQCRRQLPDRTCLITWIIRPPCPT